MLNFKKNKGIDVGVCSLFLVLSMNGREMQE